jgi:EAL domain-containing protein (putative c-di-GMP-specific phosphodiesterase class I)
LEHNVRLDDQETYTSASIGIAVYPDDGKDARTLLKNADTAMFRAKENGRHCFQFYKPEMSVSAMERLELENSLKAAFENDEFLIHYQPIIDIHKNEIKGVEALLRWRHPDKGMIHPTDFLSTVEDCGLIIAMGEWLIFTICKQMRVWQDAGLKGQNVSINLAPKQFMEQDLVAVFMQAMSEHNIDASTLSVEITEKTLIDNFGEVEATLIKLRDMGMSVLLDDFGTGYASLAYLKDFPVDVVKIDRAFIEGVPENKEDSAVVDAIAGLTRGLGLTLHAEGVENERQLDVLKGLGCQFAQGHYWSKALPGDEYEQFYMNQIYNIG